MKIWYKKQLFIILGAALLFVLGVGATIFLGFTLAPDIISYTVSTNEAVPESASVGEKCVYRSFSQISGDGPFEIKCTDENIYIFKDEVRLYRINAPLCRFTSQDVSLMRQGIYAHSLSELYELVQYLES